MGSEATVEKGKDRILYFFEVVWSFGQLLVAPARDEKLTRGSFKSRFWWCSGSSSSRHNRDAGSGRA
jgi:hypothetical protein